VTNERKITNWSSIGFVIFTEDQTLLAAQQVALRGVASGSPRVHLKVMEHSLFLEAMEVTMLVVEVGGCLPYTTNKARYFWTFKSLEVVVRHRALLE
jgi:hypothetical protein